VASSTKRQGVREGFKNYQHPNCVPKNEEFVNQMWPETTFTAAGTIHIKIKEKPGLSGSRL
jgi:hypothetical protein